MKPYMISYDLTKPGQDYEGLIARLHEIGAVRILWSQWVLRTSANAVQIRDDLARFIDSNDSLLVTGLTGEAAWTRVRVPNDTFKEQIAA